MTEKRTEFSRAELIRRAGAATLVLVAGPTASRARGAVRFPPVHEFDAEVATAWFDLSSELVRTTPGFSPPVASRAFGYAGLALYEALVPGMEDLRSLTGVLPGLTAVPAAGRNRTYDWPSVANSALADVLRGLFPASRAAAISDLETRLNALMESGLPPGIRDRSQERGRQVAAAVVEWSKSDGGHEGYLRNFPAYTPPLGPGLWVPTPPGFQPALQPYWGANRCLTIASGASCPPGEHPAYSEDPGSAFYAEGLETYEAIRMLTPEQEEIARYWADDPGLTPTPPGHSISIATQVLRAEDASLAAAAETYAKVGIAVCDAFTACWHQKYVYNLLRPVTYIQRLIDPNWTPLLTTPPFPEYTSGHSVQSGAAFQVLTDLFGASYAFVDRTHEDRGLTPRTFGSFLEAADEAAISRLYGGIHFRAAIVNGVTQGRCVGSAVSAIPFRA
jgi:hypothetical protein